MIGIFILLIIAMLLVVKYCKKTLKRVLGLIIILITLYCVVLSIDMNRMDSLREPIFAKQVNYINDIIDTYEYRGLGYRIEIDKKNDQIISATMYMFNKVIAGITTETTDEKSNDEQEYPANIEMEYLEQKGVKIKVDYVSVSDGNFDIVFNFSMEEGISNYEGIFLSGLLIVDEEENVIYKDTEENGASLTEVMEAKPIYKDENTIRQLILLTSEEFPQSKQLDITFNKIKLYNVNQGNPIENEIEGNWNLKVEV